MKGKEKTQNITIKITELDFRKLKVMAKRRGISFEELATSLIREEINK